MKKILLATAFAGFFSADAFAGVKGCETVDLNNLNAKLENVIGEGDIGKEKERFQKQIVGRERVCSMNIYRTYKADPDVLNKLESEIGLNVDTILSPFFKGKKK